MGFNLNKREFRDAIKLRYDWPVDDIPSTCVCGDIFTVDHAMICKRGGFVTQRHNELRDLEADLLSMVCSDVEIEPVLQDISGEQLGRGSNRAPDARLDIHARGFWENQRSAFFDRYTAITRTRRSAYTRGGFWTSNKELSHPLFSRQRAVWERSACNTIADWRS